MKNDLSLSTMLGGVSTFFKRYHVTMFVILVLGSLIAVAFVLNGIIQHSPDEAAATSSAQIFNQETIDKLESLRTAEEQPSNPPVPLGNRNPFVE